MWPPNPEIASSSPDARLKADCITLHLIQQKHRANRAYRSNCITPVIVIVLLLFNFSKDPHSHLRTRCFHPAPQVPAAVQQTFRKGNECRMLCIYQLPNTNTPNPSSEKSIWQAYLLLVVVIAEAHTQVWHIRLVDVIALGPRQPVVLVHPMHLHLRWERLQTPQE